jgi:hypothetical protein
MMVEGNDTVIRFFRSRAPIKSGNREWFFFLILLRVGFPLKKFDAVGDVLKKVGLNQV